jgi:hypothetical protein
MNSKEHFGRAAEPFAIGQKVAEPVLVRVRVVLTRRNDVARDAALRRERALLRARIINAAVNDFAELHLETLLRHLASRSMYVFRVKPAPTRASDLLPPESKYA